MSNWVETKIRDIAIINYGKALTFLNRYPGKFPIYGSAGLIGYHFKSVTDSPGIIIGRKGNVGKVYISNEPFWPIDTVYYISRDEIKCDFKFLFYLLQSLGLENLNEDTAVPGLNRDTVYGIRIPLPPRDIQVAIGSLLDSLDQKIGVLERQNATLGKMADTIFSQRFLADQSPYWPQKPLTTFGPIIAGQTPSKRNKLFYHNGTVPFIKIPDMHDNVFILTTKDKLTDLGALSQSRRIVPPHSILVSCLGTVGLVSFNAVAGHTNQQINSIVPEVDFYRYYLYCYLKHLSSLLINMASGSTVTPNLNLSNFSKIELPQPPNRLLVDFHRDVSLLFNRILINSQQILRLKTIFTMVLPQIFNKTINISA
ncbi:MAG: restriction endonuclease subunit S [Deltaproteobacteria bacterium]|jgi:type I restriction enzyme S subunit|nr:restriction endonuclease subunit S [Deltaproteobacteria bacterium]